MSRQTSTDTSLRGGAVTPTGSGIKVTLGWNEALETAIEGLKRSLRHDWEALTHVNGEPGGCRWCPDIEGTCAERAFARAMSLYWAPSAGVQVGPQGDCCGWEVRYPIPPNRKLLLRDNDHDERPYVLVVGAWPTYTVRGYVLGRDGKREKYRSAGDPKRDPCYLVPPDDLTRLTGTEGPWPILDGESDA